MKIVVDTNVWVSALLNRHGTPAQIRLHAARFTLVTTEEILAELSRVLNYDHIRRRHHLSGGIISEYLASIRADSTVIESTMQVSAVERDPTDNKFLACAEEASADYIVSGDPHLLELRSYQGILILTPREFLERLKSTR